LRRGTSRWGLWLVVLIVLQAAPVGSRPASAEVSIEPDFDRGAWDQRFGLGFEPRLRFFAQATGSAATDDSDAEAEEYDPWEPFNETMFEFNRQLDRFVLKPVATGWNKVLPEEIRRSLRNAGDNVGMPRRFVNSLLQLKLHGALRELVRFLMNSTLGIGGLFDVARHEGVVASNEDTGQTLGVYGIGPGPYLVLPVLRPLTVRDAIGLGIDTLLDPLTFILTIPASLGRLVGETVNERSLTLEVFQEVEESVLDLYSAVRNGYLQRRARQILE
jgi:phospholipid-binding lipoprotein MlaA